MPPTPTWAPITSADTGLPLPGLYLCAQDLAQGAAGALGAIRVGAAMAGQDLPMLAGVAIKVADGEATLLQIDFTPTPGAAAVPATITGELARGALAAAPPDWTAQVRKARALVLIVGPREVDSRTSGGVLAFQQDAEVGVAVQVAPA